MNSLGNALKYTRRHTYLHGANWRVLVISKTLAMQKCAADEIRRILDASSLKIESINRAEGWIQLEKGAIIRFKVINSIDRGRQDGDAHLLAGHQYCHIMWMYEPDDQNIRGYIASLLRSPHVPHEQLVDEKIDW